MLERRAIAMVLHCPMYAMGCTSPLKLADVGARSCKSLLALNMARLFLIARVSLSSIKEAFFVCMYF